MVFVGSISGGPPGVVDNKDNTYTQLEKILTDYRNLLRKSEDVPVCPGGFSRILDKCYRVEGPKTSLDDARSTCLDLNSALIEIETKEEFSAVQTWLKALRPRVGASVYVNAECSGWTTRGTRCPNGFHWQSGEPVDKSYGWTEGRPRPWGNAKLAPDGLALWNSDGFTMDNRPRVYKTAKALCEKEPSCYESTGSCYTAAGADMPKLKWEEGKEYCESIGAKLLVIDNQIEEDLIEDLLKQQSKYGAVVGFWIGLSRGNVNSNFQWVTGETSTYRHWLASKFSGGTRWPSDNHGDRVYLSYNPNYYGEGSEEFGMVNAAGGRYDILVMCETPLAVFT